jgi:predicted nucleic acid-binding protein
LSFVLDSSAALAWVYKGEATEAIVAVYERARDDGAWAPGHWRLEVANALEFGVRHRRHDADFRDAALAALAQLPIRLDRETDTHAWSATLTLAERYRLTLYDAAYLELACRRGLPLATLDQALRAAAVQEDVPLIGF